MQSIFFGRLQCLRQAMRLAADPIPLMHTAYGYRDSARVPRRRSVGSVSAHGTVWLMVQIQEATLTIDQRQPSNAIDSAAPPYRTAEPPPVYYIADFSDWRKHRMIVYNRLIRRQRLSVSPFLWLNTYFIDFSQVRSTPTTSCAAIKFKYWLIQ